MKISSLYKNLKDENPALRRQALSLLRNSNNSFEILKNSLFKDPSPAIRHHAAFLLGESKNKKAARFLVKAIKKDESDLVRHEAIEMLGDLGMRTKSVISFLRLLQKDKNPFIADTAHVALATLLL